MLKQCLNLSLLVFCISIELVISQDCIYRASTFAILPYANTSLALDASDPTSLQLNDFSGNVDQSWELICGYGNSLSIYHPNTGKFLDANASANASWPHPAFVGVENDVGYQNWTYNANNEGEFYNAYAQLALDVSFQQFESGTVVGVYPLTGTINQQWILKTLNTTATKSKDVKHFRFNNALRTTTVQAERREKQVQK